MSFFSFTLFSLLTFTLSVSCFGHFHAHKAPCEQNLAKSRNNAWTSWVCSHTVLTIAHAGQPSVITPPLLSFSRHSTFSLPVLQIFFSSFSPISSLGEAAVKLHMEGRNRFAHSSGYHISRHGKQHCLFHTLTLYMTTIN